MKTNQNGFAIVLALAAVFIVTVASALFFVINSSSSVSISETDAKSQDGSSFQLPIEWVSAQKNTDGSPSTIWSTDDSLEDNQAALFTSSTVIPDNAIRVAAVISGEDLNEKGFIETRTFQLLVKATFESIFKGELRYEVSDFSLNGAIVDVIGESGRSDELNSNVSLLGRAVISIDSAGSFDANTNVAYIGLLSTDKAEFDDIDKTNIVTSIKSQ